MATTKRSTTTKPRKPKPKKRDKLPKYAKASAWGFGKFVVRRTKSRTRKVRRALH